MNKIENLNINEIKFEKFKAEAKKELNDNKLFKLGICTFVITSSAFVLHLIGAIISNPIVIISALGLLGCNIFLARPTFKALDEVEKSEKIISNCEQLIESHKKAENIQKIENLSKHSNNIPSSFISKNETKNNCKKR